MSNTFTTGAWSVFLWGALFLFWGLWRQRKTASAAHGVALDHGWQIEGPEEAMQQLTFEDAQAAKEAALAEVQKNHDGWMALAVAKFHEVKAQLPAEFLGEDIRRVLTDAGLPPPKAPHVWGSFVGYMGKKGHIVPTGEWRAMKAAGSNARRSPAYALPLPQANATEAA